MTNSSLNLTSKVTNGVSLQVGFPDPKFVFRISHDGIIEINPEFSATEAAAKFWEAVKFQNPALLVDKREAFEAGFKSAVSLIFQQSEDNLNDEWDRFCEKSAYLRGNP